VFSTAEKANELKGIDTKQLEPKREISSLVTKRTIGAACARIPTNDELCCAHQKDLLSAAKQASKLTIPMKIARVVIEAIPAFSPPFLANVCSNCPVSTAFPSL
jgi:hypothetical protein